MGAVFIVVTIILAGLAAACDDDEPPDPRPPASPTSLFAPTPTPAPPPPPEPTPEELAFIEWVIALVQNNDAAGLLSATEPHFAPCEARSWTDPGTGPICREGESAGTQVQVSRCDENLWRIEDLHLFEVRFDDPVETVFRPKIAGAPSDGFEVRFLGSLRLSLGQGRITHISRCPDYDPLVVGDNVAQWVVPPQYHTFAIEALFVRLNGSREDDEFIARFPPNRKSDRHDYVVRSPGSDVARRFRPGDRICLRGWREDRVIVTTHPVTFAGGNAPCEVHVPESGIEIVDTIVRSVLRQDMVPVASLMQTRTEPCRSEDEAFPHCRAGQPEGTPVEVFDVDLCTGGPHPVWQAFQYVANPFLERAFQLYAVIRPDDVTDGEAYRVIFTQPGDGRAFWFNVSEDRVLALRIACDDKRDLDELDGDRIIAPQHDYSPR
jgi:hypothetical protein